jgi:rod shape-determining protein MreC
MRIRGFFLFRRYTLATFIFILLLSALILMSLRVKQRPGVTFVDALVIEIVSPFQKASTFVIKTVHGVFQSYVVLIHLQRENLLLKQKVAELQKENYQMKEMAYANERFQKLLQFREKISPPVIAAEVIGGDPSSWFKSITLNKGESEGIRRGMVVIAPEGIVGQILKTAPYHSTVLLITDYSSAIDAIVQRTRAKAIVEGVGEIRKVEKREHGIFQYAELVPSVDLTKLEEVLVIPEVPPPPVEEKGKKTKKSAPRSRQKKQ